MLYILPPPPSTKPPSVWDIIINFHRKGYLESTNLAKSSIKFECRERRKVNQSWYKRPSESNQTLKSHDSGGGCVRDEESLRTIKSLNECYFAGKGTALMLGSNEHLQHGSDNRTFSQLCNELSASQTSIGSSGSDIQHHLQSMFYLLRPEETLKMAVKLESLRAGRTRYLVVVSRPRQNNQHESNIINENTLSHRITSHSRSESFSFNQTSFFRESSVVASNLNNQMCSGSSRFSVNSTSASKCDSTTFNNDKKSNFQCHLTGVNDATSCKGDYESMSSCKVREESCLLGIDCNENAKTTVGMVLRVLADTAIRLDGDGGFSVSVCGRQHIFKPVSVQAMWSALQTLYKTSSKAQKQNFFAGGPSHDWVQYYEERIESDRSCLNEWHAMDSLESRRPPSPDTIRNKPTERDETERVIRTALKEIMMSVDLDEVTSKYIRGRLEEHLDMDLGEFKSFIDEEMLVILGQMDAPTEIFDHVYLGSEWNASNLEELQRNGVRHILNVTREIDNFFPGLFDYCNIRVYDDEKTDLLKHWDNTFRYISRAKMEGSKVLVHCKMGISRSASVVIAYAMKAYDWNFDKAIQHVKEKRNCIKPNKAFVSQLETYQGILDAMKNKEKLQRSKSETNLKSENAKDGKMLPGSEPTPLIQALQHNKNSTYPSSKKEASYMKRICQRPKSSPDISKSSSEVVSLIKPLSISLETLVTADGGTTSPSTGSETTNLRWPCDHGQYSVSQNQIIYLQNQERKEEGDDEKIVAEENPIVRSMISELEQLQEAMKNKEAQSWDPGDDKKQQQVQIYSSHAEIIRQDSLKQSSQVVTSVLEEKIAIEYQQAPQAFVSRQSSWSSVDSACVIGDLLPSRNSSWGSGDNRAIPSRNSSWGSYDTKTIQKQQHQDDILVGSSGIFAYEKDEIPWHPGTVKRTKQKIEEKQVPISNKINIRAKSDNVKVKENKISTCDIKQKNLSFQQPQRKFVKLASLESSSSKEQMRSKSEEYLIENKSGLLQLSASAPESSCMSIALKLQQRRQNSCDSSHGIGKVKNLKMNFEAKANQQQQQKQNSTTSSLPSSPIAIHIDVANSDSFPNEDIKSLIDRYEVPKSPNIRQRPKSMYESKFITKSSSSQHPKFISHQTKLPKNERPPIPAQQPIVVKSALMAVNTNQNLVNCRKIQQHGKTHPLTKLGINKPRINTSTAAAYNTM